MIHYEYRTIQTEIAHLSEKQFLDRLNAMGAEGWNLVATVPHEKHGYSHEVHFLFSRSHGSSEGATRA